ncbi:MAG: hypothetical protein Q8P13_01530 [bacterium]|nr:hypothetical protein [bacterium]
MAENKKDSNFEPISKVIQDKFGKPKGRVYAHHEFQDFGVYLSEQLHDPKHKALYIKLSKERNRYLLHEAMVFAIGYNTKSTNRGKLFMWKLQQLESEIKS